MKIGEGDREVRGRDSNQSGGIPAPTTQLQVNPFCIQYTRINKLNLGICFLSTLLEQIIKDIKSKFKHPTT